MGFLIRAVVAAFGLWLASVVTPGIRYDDLFALLIAAVLLGLANAVVRPVLVLLSVPLLLVTLGLFLLVINALMLLLVGAVAPGFHVASFGAAVVGAVVTGVVSWAAAALNLGGRRG